MVFLPLRHSPPEISLLSGKEGSVSQISERCWTSYSKSKGTDYSARAPSMEKKNNSLFVPPWKWEEVALPRTKMLRGLISGLYHEMLWSHEILSSPLWLMGLREAWGIRGCSQEKADSRYSFMKIRVVIPSVWDAFPLTLLLFWLPITQLITYYHFWVILVYYLYLSLD